MTHATKLRLRAVDGLLDDIQISLPVSWAATLRAQSVKLGMSLEDVVVQYAGHLAAEIEKLEAAVASPTISDDVARFRLRGSFLANIRARGFALRDSSERANSIVRLATQPALSPDARGSPCPNRSLWLRVRRSWGAGEPYPSGVVGGVQNRHTRGRYHLKRKEELGVAQLLLKFLSGL